MLVNEDVRYICDRTERYWRNIVMREPECDFFKGNLFGDNPKRLQAAACTIDAVHTILPLKSEFQRKNRLALISLGRKVPLWIRNDEGIWHPLIATVFSRADEEVVDEFPLKDIIDLLLRQAMDSLYVLGVEMDSNAIKVRMHNLLDKLGCVRLIKRAETCAVLDVHELMCSDDEQVLSLQQKMEFMVKLYQTLVRKRVDSELAACEVFSQRCNAFMKSNKGLEVNRSFQKSLFEV